MLFLQRDGIIQKGDALGEGFGCVCGLTGFLCFSFFLLLAHRFLLVLFGSRLYKNTIIENNVEVEKKFASEPIFFGSVRLIKELCSVQFQLLNPECIGELELVDDLVGSGNASQLLCHDGTRHSNGTRVCFHNV